MKKKFSIVISLAFLMFVVNSCEQEDQISYINSVEQSNSIDMARPQKHKHTNLRQT